MTVATPVVINVGKPDNHSKLSLIGIHPKYEERLTAKSGKKTLKPEAAANPIPINALRR